MNERINDADLANILSVASKNDLPSTAKVLIVELFNRLRELEERVALSSEAASKAREIASGMQGDLELLGTSPDGVNLRDRTYNSLSAIRDLAEVLLEGRDRA